jgi:hypothetical protein
MFSSKYFIYSTRKPMMALILAVALAGCESKQDKAIDQAKKQAATTGQPQQVVSVDKNGTTTTTIVQPPAPGQTTQAMTTTAAPPPVGSTPPPPSDPKISSLSDGTPEGATPEPSSTKPSAAVPVKAAIPAGTNLAIRVDQRISVKTSHAGDKFTGEVVSPIAGENGNTLVPKGTSVDGAVTVAKKRGRFKGASELELRLTAMTLDGTKYPIRTADLAQHKKGKGKRSAALIGGGTGLGMLIGGIASGGTGLLIGGLAGGGAGTAAAGLTGNRDLEIPAESIVHFKLSEDVVLPE